MLIESIELDTGEVQMGIPIWVGRKLNIGTKFFMAFQDTFAYLAKDKELTYEPRRVLYYLFSRLDFKNLIQVSQVEICNELEMKVIFDEKIFAPPKTPALAERQGGGALCLRILCLVWVASSSSRRNTAAIARVVLDKASAKILF